MMLIRTNVLYNYLMKSKWFHLKEEALILRRNGVSMTVIERKLGIPRSTLSGWFRDITLTQEQKEQLLSSKADGWAKARKQAVKWHTAQKELRLEKARRSATETLDKIPLTDEVIELAFAMLYFGEGAKGNVTSIANSDPQILRFTLSVLLNIFRVPVNKIHCDLHLRADQDADELKAYWSHELNLPIERFRYVAFDKRSIGKPTYDHYKGVCVITCGDIAIQRKIMYLYKLFCGKIADKNSGD